MPNYKQHNNYTFNDKYEINSVPYFPCGGIFPLGSNRSKYPSTLLPKIK